MMSVRVVNAGDGYAYLMNSVATHDENTAGTKLADYYNASGTPPGRWFGKGIAGLGENSSVTVGSTAQESQMAALYGEGLHPDADARINDGESIKDVQLGRQYPIFTKGVDVLEAVKAAQQAFVEGNGRRPTTDEHNLIGLETARPFYEAQAGVSASSAREVLAWLNEEKNKVKQATSGVDLTFSPQKSVSVLWALGDDTTRQAIEKIHNECVEESLEWVEDNVLFTRTGARGERQIKARGMIASTFVHYDTRAGDPDLHTHCLISNKVQAARGVDGLTDAEADKWRSIDARALLQNAARVGQRYQQRLTHRLSEELGIDFRPRIATDDKQPVWEVAGISDDLIESFSSRRTMARPVYEKYAADYAATHGHAPSDRTRYALWQQAILDTRDAKKPGKSLADHRAEWAAMHDGQALSLDDLTAQTRTAFPAIDGDDFEHAVALLAHQSVEDTRSRRAEFYRRHLDASLSMRMSQWRFTSLDHADAVRDAAETFAMDNLISRLSVATPMLPAALVREDGRVIDEDADAIKMTANETLAEEKIVLDAINTPTAFIAGHSDVVEYAAQRAEETGFELTTGQHLLASHLTETGALLAAGVGPAGTGKTASMAVVADVWNAKGHKVIALAPSATAAAQLGSDINTDGLTIASLTYRWRGITGNRPRDLSALGIEIRPGDMLLVDEAGMATTADLAALVEIAHESGAVVRMVGDPHQLDAVETGGIFRAIVKRDDSIELDQVMRMGADTEQADAGLKIRHGDESGLDLYYQRGWIHGGDRADMIVTAAENHLKDESNGYSSILIASTRADVDVANQIIREARIDAGLVDSEGATATLGGGHEVAVGDVILTRKNQNLGQLRVLNGQRFRVATVHHDGSLIVVGEENNREFVLPADYVANHVQLGYAATVHRAQGVTVDVTRAVVGPETDRRGLYVALTRGKKQNHLYVAEDTTIDLDSEDGHWHMSGENQASDHRSILTSIVTRDSGHKAATEIYSDEMTHAVSDERRGELLATATDLLTTTWRREVVEPDVRRRLDALPVSYLTAIDEDQAVERISTAVVRLNAYGVDYREVIDTAFSELDGSRDVGAVIASRLTDYLPEDKPTLRELPPLHAGVDDELHTWAHQTREHLVAVATTATPERQLRALEVELPDKGAVEGLDLSNVDLRGHDLSNLKFKDCDLRGAALDETIWHWTSFNGCLMTEMTARNAQIGVGDSFMRASLIADCDLDGADFSEAEIGQLKVFRSTMRDAALEGCSIQGTFSNVDLSGTSLEEVEITGLKILSSTVDESEKVRDHITASQRQRRASLKKFVDDETTETTISSREDEKTDSFDRGYSDSGLEL